MTASPRSILITPAVAPLTPCRAMGTRRATETPRAAALVVEVTAVACPPALAGTAAAVDRGNVGRETRVGEAPLTVFEITLAISPYVSCVGC